MPIEDDSSRKFLENEDNNMKQPVLSPEERTVVQHLESLHSRDSYGRLIVPHPQKESVKVLGESRPQEGFDRL